MHTCLVGGDVEGVCEVGEVDGLPELVTDFLASLADQVTGTAGDPWRPTVGKHLSLLGDWLDELFDRVPDRTG